MNYRRNALLSGIAALALVAGAGLAHAQDKEKTPAPQAKPPAAAAAPANKAPMAAEQPKTGAPVQRAEEMNRPKAMENKVAEPKAGMEGAKPAQKAEENERMKAPVQRTEENERTKQTPQRAEENERNNKAATEQNRAEPSKQNAATPNGAASANNKAAAANVKLSTDQRTRVKNIVLAGHGGPRVAHVNFDVRIGTVVPRGSVEYVPVPETLVGIEPAWAGFYYFIYGEEVVIIDPDTLAIVAVIEV
jgi:hypothetical protein